MLERHKREGESESHIITLSRQACCIIGVLLIALAHSSAAAAAAGDLKWSYATSGAIDSSPAIASDGTIYVASADDNLYALNPDGTLKWSFPTGGSVTSSPAIATDGTVYVGSEDGTIYAINPDGTSKWSYATGGPVESSPAIAADGTIYVGSDDDKLYALNADGSLKWSYTTGNKIQSSPAVAPDGIVYVVSTDGTLYAFNPDGTVKWSDAYFYALDASSPAIAADGTIYVGENYSIYAINPDGSIRWQFNQGYAFDASPAVAESGTVYVGSDGGTIYAINPDGTTKWSYVTGGPISSSPAVAADGTIYVGSDDHKLYALNPDGTLKWSYATGDKIASSPTVAADGTVYVGSDDDSLYAIDGESSGLATTQWPKFHQNLQSTGRATNIAGYGFESGSLGSAWQLSGDGQWTVTQTTANSGQNALQAPTIRDNQSATTQITRTTAAGNVSFALKVDSEANHDYLIFSIDGVVQNRWSGAVGWETVSFPVTAGSHTFTWVYSKDASGSSGQDSAWIDDVTFPVPQMAPAPDLVVSSLTQSPSSPTTSDTITLTAVVTNQGNATAGASALQIAVGNESSAPTYPINSLAPGATQTVMRTLTQNGAGNYQVNATADFNHAVAESHETNNVAYDFFSVTAPAGSPGSLEWSYATALYAIQSSSAIASDGTIYVASDNGTLYAVNPDGSLKWSFAAGGSFAWSSPAVANDGTVYVGSTDDYIYAINPDGTLKWKYATGGGIFSSPAIATDGTIYVGSDKLYALSPDGKPKWSFSTGGYIYLSSPAVTDDGTVYVGSGNDIVAINSDGTLKWKYATGNSVQSSPAIGADGTIYAGSYDDKLYALNPDGSLKWSFTTGGYNYLSSPAIADDGTVYIGLNDGSLYALNPDGTLKWKYATGNVITSSSPTVGADGTVYIGSTDDKLYALNPDGSLKWSFVTGNGVESSPAIADDGTVYIASDDGSLYAVDGDSGGLASSPWPRFHANSQNTGQAENVNQRPGIALVGAATMTIIKGGQFTDPGATATDAEDGNLTGSITTTSNVNTSVVGNYTVTYTVTDSGGLSASVTRTVVVENPPVSLSSPSNFSTSLGGTSTQTVTLSNAGAGPLSITSITASGDFTATNNCGSTLDAGASCSINVTFTPQSGGAASGSLTVTSNAPTSPDVTALSGSGTFEALSASDIHARYISVPPSAVTDPSFSTDNHAGQTFTFNADGTGTYTDYATSATFSWSLATDGSISIDFNQSGYDTTPVPVFASNLVSLGLATQQEVNQYIQSKGAVLGYLPVAVKYQISHIQLYLLSTAADGKSQQFWVTANRTASIADDATRTAITGDVNTPPVVLPPVGVAIKGMLPNQMTPIAASGSSTPWGVQDIALPVDASNFFNAAVVDFKRDGSCSIPSLSESCTWQFNGPSVVVDLSDGTSVEFTQYEQFSGAKGIYAYSTNANGGHYADYGFGVPDGIGASANPTGFTAGLLGKFLLSGFISTDPSDRDQNGNIVLAKVYGFELHADGTATRVSNASPPPNGPFTDQWYWHQQANGTIVLDFRLDTTTGLGAACDPATAPSTCMNLAELTWRPLAWDGSRLYVVETEQISNTADPSNPQYTTVEAEGVNFYDVYTQDLNGDGINDVQEVLDGIDPTQPHVNQPPSIALVGAATMTIAQGSQFTDPGATATDAEDGNLTGSIVTTSNVKTSVPGNYTVTYKVTDSGSLSASVTRNVVVTAAPLVSLSSPSTISAKLGGSSTQTVTLSNTGSASMDITGIAASGDFSATDNCGNTLDAGAKCAITVTYAPQRGGAETGSLTVTSNAASSPDVISLNGTSAFEALAAASDVHPRYIGVYPGAVSDPSFNAHQLNGATFTFNSDGTGAYADFDSSATFSWSLARDGSIVVDFNQSGYTSTPIVDSVSDLVGLGLATQQQVDQYIKANGGQDVQVVLTDRIRQARLYLLSTAADGKTQQFWVTETDALSIADDATRTAITGDANTPPALIPQPGFINEELVPNLMSPISAAGSSTPWGVQDIALLADVAVGTDSPFHAAVVDFKRDGSCSIPALNKSCTWQFDGPSVVLDLPDGTSVEFTQYEQFAGAKGIYAYATVPGGVHLAEYSFGVPDSIGTSHTPTAFTAGLVD